MPIRQLSVLSCNSGIESNLTNDLKRRSADDVSEDGVGLGPDWDTEVVPYIEKKFEQVFSEY
jgi:hypothetical protein